MQITWYGHSCFLLADGAGTRILTDPCDPSVGYDIHGVACDAVTVSHGHYDHCYVEAAAGTPTVIDTEGAHRVAGVSVTGFPSWHDEVQGEKRGANLLFRFGMDGLTALHLGDLGHMLSDEAIADIGPVDVLLLPVGGNYTIDAAEAWRVVTAMQPAVVIPMHYRTPACRIEISGVEPFLQQAQAPYSISRLNDSVCRIEKDTLSIKRVLLMEYVK